MKDNELVRNHRKPLCSLLVVQNRCCCCLVLVIGIGVVWMVDQAQLQLQYQIYCMLLNQHSAQQGSPFAEWLAMVVIDHLLVQLPSFRY